MGLKPQERPARPRGNPRLWLAALPAFLLTIGMSTWSILRFAGVQPALDLSPPTKSKAAACAEVYGVETYNSEYYVKEAIRGLTSPKAQREFATVVSGMVENKCDEPLRSVRINIKVKNGEGARASGEATVRDVRPGQAKRFERAWIGQIESYEIAEIR